MLTSARVSCPSAPREGAISKPGNSAASLSRTGAFTAATGRPAMSREKNVLPSSRESHFCPVAAAMAAYSEPRAIPIPDQPSQAVADHSPSVPTAAWHAASRLRASLAAA